MKKLSIFFGVVGLALSAALASIPASADLIKQSSSYPRTFTVTSNIDHTSPALGITSFTVYEGKAGAAQALVTPTITEIGNGKYSVALTSSDTNTLGALDLVITASGADQTDTHDQIVGFDPGSGTNLGLTGLPAAAPGTTGGLIPIGTGAGQLNPTGSGTLPAGPGITTALTGTATAGGSSSITLAAGPTTTDLEKGNFIAITGGTGAGQARTITAYNGGTLVATLSRPWAVTPDATSTYAVVMNPHPALDSNLAVAANGVNGNVTGSVGSVTGPVGSVTSPVVASSVTGSVGSVTGAVGSVTNPVAASSVTGSVGSVTGSVGSVTGSVGSVTSPVSLPVTPPSGYGGGSGGGIVTGYATGQDPATLLASSFSGLPASIWGYSGGRGITAYTGNTPQTGDAYLRLGAPAGASTAADIAAAQTGITANGTAITALPASVAAAVQAIPVESTETLIQTLRILRAVLAGNSTVTGQTVTFKRKDGTTAAVTITNDSLGNRTGSTPGILAP